MDRGRKAKLGSRQALPVGQNSTIWNLLGRRWKAFIGKTQIFAEPAFALIDELGGSTITSPIDIWYHHTTLAMVPEAKATVRFVRAVSALAELISRAGGFGFPPPFLQFARLAAPL